MRDLTCNERCRVVVCCVVYLCAGLYVEENEKAAEQKIARKIKFEQRRCDEEQEERKRKSMDMKLGRTA